MAELEVYSPIDGQIVTWDLTTSSRPARAEGPVAASRCQSGRRLGSLILHMPEDQMGHIARAKKLADERNEQLPVSYILATEPGTTLKGTVKEIGARPKVRRRTKATWR